MTETVGVPATIMRGGFFATSVPATIMRGTKIRIFPSQRQAEIFDLWRRRTIQLWNLLLNLEQSAYSGENVRRELGWRSLWAQVVEESHAEAVRVAHEGKMRKDGTYRKAPGEKQPPPPLDETTLAKIKRQWQAEIDPETEKPENPRLFIWEHELQKVMARLKQVPNTKWIGDLPSHAAQSVVKDLIKALQNMLRERKKRASGAGGRDTGFPKFKKSRYAAGSVYLANTQFGIAPEGEKIPSGFDLKKGRIKFPGGVGWVSCREAWFHQKRTFAKLKDAKLMGGRIWRQGEEWFFSCQWEMPNTTPAAPTGRTAGIKIDTKLITTYDDRGQTREYRISPRPDIALGFEHKFAGKKLARILRAQKTKQDKLTARKKRRIAELTNRGLAANYLRLPRPARIKRSAAFFETSAWLADCEARERNRRDDRLHKLTTSVAEKFDAVAIQKMEVAELMKRPSKRRQRRHEQKTASGDQGKRPRDLKPVRKMMRQAAMARGRQLIEYKMKDRRGTDGYHEIGPHDVNVSASSVTGTVFPEWKDGRRVVHARETLPDGSVAVTRLPRNRNAARLSERELKARKSRRKA